MRTGVGIGTGIGFGAKVGAAGPATLAAGEYFLQGLNVGATPHEGQGWNSTLLFDDGAPGDTTTGEQGTGGSIMVLHVFAAPLSLDAWALTIGYRGTLSQNYHYWDGAAWVALTDTNGALWGTHVGFSDEARTATFAPTNVTYLRGYFTEGNQASGQTIVKDSRPS